MTRIRLLILVPLSRASTQVIVLIGNKCDLEAQV